MGNEAVNLLSSHTLTTIGNECGLSRAGALALRGGMELINRASDSLLSFIVGLGGVLKCKSINPIYTTFMHDALCMDGVTGLIWLFSTTVSLSFFSMLMICFQ